MNCKVNKYLFSNPWLAFVLITITITIIYSNIYNSPFVFDDKIKIVENESIRDLNHFFSFKQITIPRNVVFLTFALNYKINGLNVAGYHIVNILIHIINGFLVYFLALMIFRKLNKTSTGPDSSLCLSPFYKRSLTCSENSLMSLFAALIFVAHPIQTQAVTYTIQRMTSMAAMFYLASVFFYLKARFIAQSTNHKPQRKVLLTCPPELSSRAGYILSAFCGILALLSKQNTASLPGAILLVEYLFISRAWQDWKKTIPWFTFSFTLWAISVSYVLGLFSNEFNSSNMLEDISGLTRAEQVSTTFSRWQYLCTQFNVLVIYIRLLFLPIHQCFDYLYPYKNGFFDGYTSIAFLFLTGLTVIGIMNIRKRPMISMAVFWFFITLSVESSIIPLYAYFEHRLYLPMFGFSIFSSWLLFHFLHNKRFWVIVVYGVIIVSLGTATYHRNGVWQNRIGLWSDVLSKSPKNHRAYHNLGLALVKQERFEEAIGYYYEILRIIPNYVYAYYLIGDALSKQGKYEEAKAHYEEALRINPDYAEVHNNLGNVLLKQDKPEEAILHYKEMLRIDPGFAKAYYNLGNIFSQQGRYEEAITHYKKALRIDPDYAKAYHNLGIALARDGNFEDTISYYKEILRNNPGSAEAHNNLGELLFRQEKPDEAIGHYFEALRIDPDYDDAHYNLGVALEKKGGNKDAIFHYEEALRANPNHVKAHENLGVILSRQGRYNSAIAHFSEVLRINPDDADVHYNIALTLDLQGRIENSITEYREVLRLEPNMLEALDNLAWIFATSKNPNFRNAAEAVKLAEKACALTAHEQPLMLDTLAAAYAESGRFDNALQTAQKAMEIASSNGLVGLARKIEKRMQIYQSGSPFYENTLTTNEEP